MESSKTRHRNFMALFKLFRDKNAHLPNRGMLKLFAQELDLSERFMSHIKCDRKQIGSVVARQIEEKLGLDVGWLDQEHSEFDPQSMAERAFLENMITLFRSSPSDAQEVMVQLLKSRLQKN